MPRLLLALLFCASAHAADGSVYAPPAGPHAVGLKVIQQYDRSRAYKPRVSLVTGKPTEGERARPLQMLVWYPAERGGKAVTFHDYLDTVPTEEDFQRTAAEVKKITDARFDRHEPERRTHLLREALRPMLAVRDARAAAGKFPVVIYAPSFSASAIESTDLCEYLASQGYVVLSSASLGAHTRAMTTDLDGLEAQVGDIAYLIAYAGTLPQADLGRAVAGFSWGGLSNVLAAAKDDRIKAIVSLDGSIRGFREFVDGGKDAAKYVTPARVTIPMLYVGRRPGTFEELNRSEVDTRYSFMNEMKYSDVFIATLMPMKHPDFSSWHLRTAQDSDFGDYSRSEVVQAHSWAVRYTARFLDAYLKDDAAARTFIANKPAANGVPAHMMSIDVRRGSGVPPTRETFASLLDKRGFDQAGAIYKELQAQGATFKLESHDINAWGYELLHGGMPKESIAIFRFGTELLPADANLYDSLAEAQAEAGQRDEAIRNYRRSLELNPQNTNAVARLKVLGAAPAAAGG